MNNTQREGEFDCEELEELINDVRAGVKDSAHIHTFVRNEVTYALASFKEGLVKRIEAIKTITGNPEAKIGADAFKRAVLAIIKDKGEDVSSNN